ncbi:tape measure protein [Pseudomonas marginalis]|uniref:tape measure protein n=1 Tax=Pseudomonas marginalis TaxID=298 RepID=UPI003BA2AAC5
MSMNEEIARLTGSLFFKVDPSGLQRLLSMLKSAEVAMARAGKQADALSVRMSKSLGLKVDTTAQAKLDKQLRSSLDRELRGEVLLQKAKRATFQAELQGQKLQFAGQRELAFLSTAAIRDKQALAVLAAKEQATQAAKLKVQGLALKNEDAVAQAKARQVRAESILATQQARTIALQAQQQRTLTATQRIEQSMMQARERGQRQAQKFLDSQAAAKVRSQRQDVAHQQRQERFQWAQTRQAQWEATNRNKPAPSTGFLGLGTGALAVGGAAAGVAAIVGAISALGARMSAVQDRVSESQSWANTIEQAGGANPANRDFAKAEFLRITDKYGTSAGLDEAKEYRTFLLHQMAVGKSISQSTKMYETQMSAFRGAGMSKDEMQRANRQLTQVRAKGKGDTEDINTFSEAAPLLVDPIKQAWAERNKYKGDNLERDFRASFAKGNLKAVDFERGLEIFNRDNKPAIEKQSSSIDSNATRLANKQFLQQQGLDQNPELIGVINQRLQSEMELTEAMGPLKEKFIELDILLNKANTSLLRSITGRNSEGNPLTPTERAQALGDYGGALDVNLKRGDISQPTEQQRLDAAANDPITRFARFLGFGADVQAKADENRKRWKDVGFSDHAPWDIRPEPLDLSNLNTKGLPNYGKRLEDLLSQSDPNAAVAKFATAAAANASRAAPGSRGEWVSDERAVKSEPVTNNVTNNTPITVEVNITAKTDASAAEIGSAVSGQVREEVKKIFQEYTPTEIH